MKSLKENYLVNASYTYINIIYKLYPVVILYFLIRIILSMGTLWEPGLNYPDFDFFNLFTIANISSTIYSGVILIFNLAVLAGVFIGLKKLFEFFKNVRDEKPFAEENGRHLKYIGVLILLITMLAHFAKTISLYIEKVYAIIGTIELILWTVAVALTIVFNPFFILGIFVYALGEIIILASRIKQENDLTV